MIGPSVTEVVLSGLTITGGTGWEGPGVGVNSAARAVIADCTLSGNEAAGLWLVESAQAVVVGSRISQSAFGIILTDASRAAVVSCEIFANPWGGLVVGGSSSGTITNCTITGSDSFGIALGGTSHTTITTCTISGNMYGIGVRDSAHVVIEDNRIVASKEFGVMLIEPPCFLEGGKAIAHFSGYVTGARNSITALQTPEGSVTGNLCPEPDLGFLMTDEGGELDRRK